jgi:hypothetical protein
MNQNEGSRRKRGSLQSVFINASLMPHDRNGRGRLSETRQKGENAAARVYRTRKNKAISSQAFLCSGFADVDRLEKSNPTRGMRRSEQVPQAPVARRRPAQFSDGRST